MFLFVCEAHPDVAFSVVPGIPFGPNYKSEQGQISEGFFSRVDAPRAHTEGFMYFPWGQNYTIQSVGSLKHTWGYKTQADALSAYVRGSLLLPNLPPIPDGTLTWFQAWDNAGKGMFVFPLDGVSRRIY